MKKALALDVGGTKIYNAIINENGEIISEIEKHSTPKTYEEIKQVFTEIIKKHEKDVDVIAFSTCGAVNNENTQIIGSTGNIAKGYPNMPFRELSTKPVFVENDANCAAWAEHEIGSSKLCKQYYVNSRYRCWRRFHSKQSTTKREKWGSRRSSF